MYNPQLETFLRVADAGSFNKAAAESFITPTAVIKQINLLEETLGVSLFQRTHRGLILTEAGKSMYQDAKHIIQYCRDSVARAKNAVKTENELIRIGTSPMTPASVLLELWPRIHERCPGMKFKRIPFDNTPENAKEILGNLGQNIDVVAGIFDDTMLDLRHCAGVQLRMEPICCAVSIHHPLAGKARLRVEELYGENLLLMHPNWSHYVDELRDDFQKNHGQIHIQSFDFYNMEVFNRCENSNDILMAVAAWENVHPLLKILPVEWDYQIPYGLLHSPKPSDTVKKFLSAIQNTVNET